MKFVSMTVVVVGSSLRLLSVPNANGNAPASSAAPPIKRVAPVKTSSRKKCYCDIELIKRKKSPTGAANPQFQCRSEAVDGNVEDGAKCK